MDTDLKDVVKEIVIAVAKEFVTPLSNQIESLRSTVMQTWHSPETCPRGGELKGLRDVVESLLVDKKENKKDWKDTAKVVLTAVVGGVMTLVLALLAEKIGLKL